MGKSCSRCVNECKRTMASQMLVWLLCSGLAFDGAVGAKKDHRLRNSITDHAKTPPAPEGPLAAAAAASPSSPPGAESTCKSLVEIYGYGCEEHAVTTEDGYILSIQRIPSGRSGAPAGASKIPVLLQHGLMMDGTTWLLNSPDESLGYILADNGYDVWIANGRGTVYSQGHTSLSSEEDSAYWNWSWDELAAYDLPAMFEYVYQQTGNQMIHYVGHSQGTLVALASISQRKNLLSMLRSASLLGPVAYMGQVSSPIARGGARLFAAEAYYWLGQAEFNPDSQVVQKLLTKLCKIPGVNCYDLLSSFTGTNCCLNTSAVHVFLDHKPQPTATKNMVHLSQMMRRGTLTKYDYDDDTENMSHYGQIDPPAYDVSSMIPNDLPLFLSYGGQDELSDPGDVQRLVLYSLNSHDSDKLTVQYLENYAHADFVMAYNAKELIYNPLMDFLKLH